MEKLKTTWGVLKGARTFIIAVTVLYVVAGLILGKVDVNDAVTLLTALLGG